MILKNERVLIINDSSFLKNTKYDKWTTIFTNFGFLEDSLNSLTINHIKDQTFQKEFIPYTNQKIKQNVNYWIKLPILKLSACNKILLVSSINWEVAELYTISENNKIQILTAGMNSKRPDYGFDHYNYFLPELETNKITLVFLKLRCNSRNPEKITIKLNDFNLYKEGLSKYKLIYVSFLSILIIMIICIGFIYILVKKRVFFLYMIMLIAFVGAFSIFLFYNIFNGYINFLITEQFFYSLAVSVFVLFTLSYFNTSEKSIRLFKLSIISVIIFSLIFITHIILVLVSKSYPFYSQNIFMFAIVFLLLMVYIITFNAIKHKFKLAWFFLLSITFSCLSGIYMILTISKILNFSSQMEAKKLFLISLILLITFFSLSIGYLIYKLAEKRAKMIQENLNIQKNINEKLEIEVRKRTKEIIDKNLILEKQKEEILAQNEEILTQRDELLKHQTEITDSINYAKRIQTAILPPEELIKKILPEHFILYKPRDIVSGDFYWVKHINKYILFAVVDCTGHGVPGAFMSMLGTAFMNEIARRQEVTKPCQFLGLLRNQVKRSLRQTGRYDEAKDGMDIALCVIDTETDLLQYSGANNPLFLFRENKLHEIKADRMPVGIHAFEEKEFTNHEIKLRKKDMIYIFSDGYKDQIGGAKGKKFMAGQFKELLSSIHKKEVNEQKTILNDTIEKWKDYSDSDFHHGQVDDILIMGIQI